MKGKQSPSLKIPKFPFKLPFFSLSCLDSLFSVFLSNGYTFLRTADRSVSVSVTTLMQMKHLWLECRWWVSEWADSVDRKSHMLYLHLQYLPLSLCPADACTYNSLQPEDKLVPVWPTGVWVWLLVVQLCMKDVCFLTHRLHQSCRSGVGLSASLSLFLSHTPALFHTVTHPCVFPPAYLSINEFLSASHDHTHFLSLTVILSLAPQTHTLMHLQTWTHAHQATPQQHSVFSSVL